MKKVHLVEEKKLYRGIGNNYADEKNEGFLWGSPDKELAENYSSGEIEEFDININDMNILELPYKGNPKIQGSVFVGNILYPLLNIEFKKGNIKKDEIDYFIGLVENIELLMNQDSEYIHTKINKPKVAKSLSSFLEELDYDAISLMENNIKTIGIIKL